MIKNLKPLETMNANEVMTTIFERQNFVIKKFLPQGLNIIAGAPKIGKSMLCLWLALQVAKGEKVWDFETNQGGVLYLCLEDNYARIQGRLFELTEEGPENLHLAIAAATIGNGLEQQIEEFITLHPDIKFVIIDTLQKVRDNANANANTYASDYGDIGALKSFADKHKLSLNLVHHLRKTVDDDPLNMISGTSGLAGGADNLYILQKQERISNRAKLTYTGRDVVENEIALIFNEDTMIWETVEPIDIKEEKVDEIIITLSVYIKESKCFTGTATELKEILDSILDKECNAAVLKKKILKDRWYLEDNGITYTENRTFERREFTLRYDANDGMTEEMSVSKMPSVPSEPSAVEDFVVMEDDSFDVEALFGGKSAS